MSMLKSIWLEVSWENSLAATEWALQDATFSFTDFAVWALKIQGDRMPHHAKTTTLPMLPRQVHP